MSATAYILLGMGIGFLTGLAAVEASDTLLDKTCYVISLSGREHGIRFSVLLPAGVECVTVIGATK